MRKLFFIFVIQLLSFETFCQEKINKLETFYSSGQIKSIEYYYGDIIWSIKVGNSIYWFENGQKEKEGVWKIQAPYDKEISINYDSIFIIGNHFKNLYLFEDFDTLGDKFILLQKGGWTREWYPNGNIKKKCTEDSLNNKVVCFEYYETGEIESIEEYTNARKDGISKQFYKNGNEKVVAFYTNGKLITIIYKDELGNVIKSLK